MAIKIKELETLAEQYTAGGYVYKDLSLDLSKTKIQTPGLQVPVPGIDIKASFDLEAISNSLLNLFNTVPGQRFLFPTYGLNLKRFLFSPVTQTNGQALGDIIYSGIRRFEPRVTVEKVLVKVIPDDSKYEISIAVTLPATKTSTQIGFLFDIKRESFVSLPVQY